MYAANTFVEEAAHDCLNFNYNYDQWFWCIHWDDVERLEILQAAILQMRSSLHQHDQIGQLNDPILDHCRMGLLSENWIRRSNKKLNTVDVRLSTQRMSKWCQWSARKFCLSHHHHLPQHSSPSWFCTNSANSTIHKTILFTSCCYVRIRHRECRVIHLRWHRGHAYHYHPLTGSHQSSACQQQWLADPAVTPPSSRDGAA